MTADRPDGPPDGSPLVLVTLGGARLSRGDAVTLGPGKPLALMTYLALAPGRAASREFLLDLLWADLDHDRARHALRQTLWQLRQLLGDDCISGREELFLGLPVAADRDRFLEAVDQGDLGRALALYGGGFLPDFALPGSTAFEHWADIERSRLRAAFLHAAETVARRHVAAGRFRDAQQIARRMRDADRFNESAWRLLLESLLANRDRTQAALEASALRGILAAEERDPEPATRRVLARLDEGDRPIEGDTAAAEPIGLVAELVGRERQFAMAIDAWNGARGGTARHLRILAPAGLGKTRLLTDLGHRLRAHGARVVYLRAHPGDRVVPYSLAGDLAAALGGLPGLPAISPSAASTLVGLSPALSSRFPTATPEAPSSERLRLRIAALTEAITEVAEESALALLIDDTHWLDKESRQVLDGVLHRLSRARVFVLTAGRPIEERPVETGATTTTALESLSLSETEALVTSLGRFEDRDTLTRLVAALQRSTDGSPLLVLETLQLALEQGWLGLGDGSWHCPDFPALIVRLEAGGALRTRLGQLDRDAAWILLLLATAGTPLSSAEIKAGIRASDRLDELLWLLERKGLIARTGGSWEASHDEIAATALEMEPADRRRAAHQTVGRILLGALMPSPTQLIQAGRHFVRADDATAIGDVFIRLVAAVRRHRDRRTPLDLASELLDLPASDPAPRALVRRLPLRTRLGIDTPLRLTAAAVLLVAAVSAAAWAGRPRSTSPRVTVLTVVWPDSLVPSRLLAADFQLDPERWSADTRIDAGRVRARRPSTPADIQLPRFGPSGTKWVGVRNAGATLTTEVVVGDPSGSAVVASSPRDDDGPTLAPDERQIAFSSARWSPAGDDDADIAVVDLPTGAVRQLTRGRAYDVEAAWSPDGTRIGFARRRFGGPTALCWVTADGAREKCYELLEGSNHLIGWLGAEELIVRIETLQGSRLALMNADDGRRHDLETDDVITAFASYDGRWIACRCQRRDADVAPWIVFPAEEPRRSSRIVADPSRTYVRFKPAHPVLAHLDRLAIVTPDQPLAVGAPVLLRLAAANVAGSAIDVSDSVLTWSTPDTAIASIDDRTGRLIARRAGRVRVSVSAGGWRTATIEIEVVPDRTTALLTETWQSGLAPRWVPFGTPAPAIVSGPGDTAGFLNGGDGSYTSGAESAIGFAIDEGLGLEAAISVPVTRDHWQSLGVSFNDERSIRFLDRAAGIADPINPTSQFTCGIGAGGEGPFAKQRLTIGSMGRGRKLIVPGEFHAGGWRTVRIQIFPDRTCGVAVDGVPRWRFTTPLPSSGYRVILSGSSVDTRVLVGPLQVWRGVRTDLDWDRLTP